MNSAYAYAAIAVCAVVTMLTRALPYLAFGRRELPGAVRYLGNTLPAAIMVLLVAYCLRGIDFMAPPHGLFELVSAGVVIAAQLIRKNTLLSVGLGTACYMLLLRLM